MEDYHNKRWHRLLEIVICGSTLQTFIIPTDLQINLDAKSKPGGQNGLIWNKYLNIFFSNWAFLVHNQQKIHSSPFTLEFIG